MQQKRGKRRPSRLYLTIRSLAYYLDYLARYVTRILPLKIKGVVVLCDRYAYDMYLDGNTVPFSKILLEKLYPNPDLLIWLHADEDEIMRRKDEYDRETRRSYLNRLTEVAQIYEARQVHSEGVARTCEQIVSLIEHLR